MKRGSGISCGGTYRGFLLECEGIATVQFCLAAVVRDRRPTPTAVHSTTETTFPICLSPPFWLAKEPRSCLERESCPNTPPTRVTFYLNARTQDTVREWTTITTTNHTMPVNVEVRL